MLLVVPDVPGTPSRKPLVQGYGCRLVGGGKLVSCEALYVHAIIPDQTLDALLFSDAEQPPKRVVLDWSAVPPALHRDVIIDVAP